MDETKRKVSWLDSLLKGILIHDACAHDFLTNVLLIKI